MATKEHSKKASPATSAPSEVCKQCGSNFTPTRGGQKFCKTECFHTFHNIKPQSILDLCAIAEPVKDNFYYYQWTHSDTGEILYSLQHVASPPPIPQRYTIVEVTREEYEAGVAQSKAEAERERFIMYNNPCGPIQVPDTAPVIKQPLAEIDALKERVKELEAENSRMQRRIDEFVVIVKVKTGEIEDKRKSIDRLNDVLMNVMMELDIFSGWLTTTYEENQASIIEAIQALKKAEAA